MGFSVAEDVVVGRLPAGVLPQADALQVFWWLASEELEKAATARQA